MPLIRIADLNGPPEHVADCIEKAKGLSGLYDDYCNDEDPDAHERAPGIHASELSPCKRRVVYNVLGYAKKPKISKFWRQRFRHGHAIHGWVQDDFRRLAARTRAAETAGKVAIDKGWTLEFDDEVRVSPKRQKLAAELQIHSSCDGVFTFRDETGEIQLRVALEIKSASPDAFEKLRRPEESHLEQAHVYMACLDVPLTWFFYFSKGTQNVTASNAPYLVCFDPTIWAKTEAKIRDALSFAERKELPERTETIVCQFCPFSYECQPQILQPKQKIDPLRLSLRTRGE